MHYMRPNFLYVENMNFNYNSLCISNLDNRICSAIKPSTVNMQLEAIMWLSYGETFSKFLLLSPMSCDSSQWRLQLYTSVPPLTFGIIPGYFYMIDIFYSKIKEVIQWFWINL